MSQSTFSVRMDDVLKDQFDSLCKEFGMNMSTAINVFAKAVVRERRIPFEISSPKQDVTLEDAAFAFDSLRRYAQNTGISGLSLKEINDEINLSKSEEEKI